MRRYIPALACWWLTPPSPRKDRRGRAGPFKPPSASARRNKLHSATPA